MGKDRKQGLFIHISPDLTSLVLSLLPQAPASLALQELGSWLVPIWVNLEIRAIFYLLVYLKHSEEILINYLGAAFMPWKYLVKFHFCFCGLEYSSPISLFNSYS
jgi:hypothetical protein